MAIPSMNDLSPSPPILRQEIGRSSLPLGWLVRILTIGICLCGHLHPEQIGAAGQVNVIEFGADPQAVRDSTPAFQRSIDYLNKLGGGDLIVPCGTYLLTSRRESPAILISRPTVSIIGANQSCVKLDYRGSGIAIVLKMQPFTVEPAGQISGLTIIGHKEGQIGIKIIGLVGAKFNDLNVRGFTTGDGFRLEDSASAFPPDGSWIERTVWIGVSEIYNKIGWHLVTTGNPKNNSFGYNDFLSISMNVTAAQTGFWLDQGGYLYGGTFRAICNADTGDTELEGPTCIRSSGNWSDEFVWVTGELSTTRRASHGSPTSLRVDLGAAFNGFGQILVSGMQVRNFAASKFEQSVYLADKPQSWDTGTQRRNGIDLSPEMAIGGRGGNIGILVGKDIESPFVSMYDAPGNEFSIGSLAYGSPLSLAKRVWEVDNNGSVQLAGSEHANGRIAADKGFIIPKAATRPECNETTRGTIWVEQKDSDQGDLLELCQKTNGVLTWKIH